MKILTNIITIFLVSILVSCGGEGQQTPPNTGGGGGGGSGTRGGYPGGSGIVILRYKI